MREAGEIIASADVPGVPRKPNKLTLLPLIGVTYCMVAGGPFGLEDLVKMAGYKSAIFLLLLTPVIWSLPVALLVSELASALPQDGGFYYWVKRGLGPFWGFQEVWLSLAASVFDMAIYPTLFVYYLGRLWPGANGGFNSIAIGVGMIAVCVAANLCGVKTVGNWSVWMTALLLLPFVVMGAYAVLHSVVLHPVVHETAPANPHGDLLGGVLIAMWNYMGWDNTSTIAGEVEGPQRTYPLAMACSVVLVAATYILPIAFAWYAGIPGSDWETGSWVNIGETIMGQTIAGRGLGIAIMLAGMISSLSMFNALVLSYSRLPAALADDGYLPKIFAKRSSKTQVPWFAVIACATLWAACLGFGFERLVILDALLYGLSLLLEFAALIALRIKEPALSRPYRIPGGLKGAICVGVIPIPLIIAAIIESRSVSGFALGCALIAAGIGVYFVGTRWRRDGRNAPDCG